MSIDKCEAMSPSICPQCGVPRARIVDTRPSPRGRRRRRKCIVCDHRWTTLEIPEELMDAMTGNRSGKIIKAIRRLLSVAEPTEGTTDEQGRIE